MDYAVKTPSHVVYGILLEKGLYGDYGDRTQLAFFEEAASYAERCASFYNTPDNDPNIQARWTQRMTRAQRLADEVKEEMASKVIGRA